MSAARAGRHRQAVHRRRRTLGVLVLLVVAAVVVLALWRPWISSADADPDMVPAPSASPSAPAATPSSSPTPTPSPTPTQRYTPIGGIPEGDDGGGGACTPEQVVITPITDAVTYAAGQQVQLSFRIENQSDSLCSLNVGTTQQEYEIRTGEQVVFRSSDCPVDAVDQIVELEPRVPQQTVPIVWDRTSSTPETCAAPRDQVVAGGASYHLSVTVSGIPSPTTMQIILG